MKCYHVTPHFSVSVTGLNSTCAFIAHNSWSNNAVSQICKACWFQERLLVLKTVCSMFWSVWLDAFCAESTWTTSKVPPHPHAFKCFLENFMDCRPSIESSVPWAGQLPALEWKFMWDLNSHGFSQLRL